MKNVVWVCVSVNKMKWTNFHFIFPAILVGNEAQRGKNYIHLWKQKKLTRNNLILFRLMKKRKKCLNKSEDAKEGSLYANWGAFIEVRAILFPTIVRVRVITFLLHCWNWNFYAVQLLFFQPSCRWQNENLMELRELVGWRPS